MRCMSISIAIAILRRPTAKQAKAVYQFLDSNSFSPMHKRHCLSAPNYDLQGKSLDTKNCWRGPVLINTNWRLMKGVERPGFEEKVMPVRHDVIELASAFTLYPTALNPRRWRTQR